MTDNTNELDELVDDATHLIVNNLIDARLDGLSMDARSALMVRINDALSPVLRDALEPAPAAEPAVRPWRVYLRGMTSTDVVVGATTEAEARRKAHKLANDDSFDWGGVELDTTSTDAEELGEGEEV